MKSEFQADMFDAGQTAIAEICAMSLPEKVAHGIDLIRENEPKDGYYLGFSGGKDSGVLKHLAMLSGVKFEAWYNQTTIDPPELVRFIKEHHPDVGWNVPDMPMMKMVAETYKIAPTRKGRWCCEVYKEGGGEDMVKLMGVRAQEAPRRKKLWREVIEVPGFGAEVVCPILYWSEEEIWAYTRSESIPYCSLYDEGFTRLGCVGCPLASKKNIDKEFSRWPGFERSWKKAILASWEKWHAVPREKDGMPRFHAKFATAEDYWLWWRTQAIAETESDEQCQLKDMWT